MIKVYVAGKLSDRGNDRTPSQVVTDYLQNVSKMLDTAVILRDCGFAPYTPCLDLLLGIKSGNWNLEDYEGISLEFLEVCDCMLVISQSGGVLKEIEKAHALGIPIFYDIDYLLRANL